MKASNTGPSPGNGARRQGLNPVRRFKAVRREGYRAPAIRASPLYEELADTLLFASCVVRKNRKPLFPEAQRYLVRAAEILQQELAGKGTANDER